MQRSVSITGFPRGIVPRQRIDVMGRGLERRTAHRRIAMVEQYIPVDRAVVVAASAVGDRYCAFGTQQPVGRTGRNMRLPGSGRVRPKVAQGLSGQQRPRCHQGFEKVLIERQSMFAAGILRQGRGEPVGKGLRDIRKRLSARAGVAPAASPSGARIVGTGECYAGVGRTAQQARLSTARMADYRDAHGIHLADLLQRINGAVIGPGPCGERSVRLPGALCKLRVLRWSGWVGSDLHTVESGKRVTPL